MNTAVKKFLLTGSALVAVSMMGAGAAHAIELNDTTHPDITAAVPSGLQETTGTTAVTINSTPVGAGLVIGANATPSVNMTSVGNTLTLNVTAAGTPYGVTFADNVNAAVGTNVIINNTNDSVYFYGDVSNRVAVNAGSNSADPTVNVTINTFNAESIIFGGTINAVDAADTVNIGIYNSHGGGNAITFTGAIGGGTNDTRVDSIQIGDNNAAPMQVNFQSSVNAQGAITLGKVGGTNINSVSFGVLGGNTGYTGTIQGAEVADTNNIHIIGGSTTTFNSDFGNMLDNIEIGNTGTTNVTFHGSIAAISGALTLTGGAGVTNNVTFAASGGNLLTVAPTLVGVDPLGTHNITIAGGAGQTVLMLGGGTNIDSYTINSGTTLRYQSSSINNVSGTGGNLTLDSNNAQSAGNIGNSGRLANFNLEGTGAKTLTTAINADTTNIGAVTVHAQASFVGNVRFTSNGTLNFADNAGANGPGNISAANNGHGTVNFAGSSAIDGTIGSATEAIGALNINGGSGTNVAFNGTTHAGTVSFSSAGTLNMGNSSGGSQIAHLVKTGAGSTATVNNLGTTLTIGDINVAAGGKLDVNGPAVSGNATLGNGATLEFAGATLGAVSGQGAILTLDGGAAQQVGAIGASGQALTTVNLVGLGNKTITGAVYAGTTNIDDITVTAQNATFHSNVNFTANSTLNLANASTITGNVTNDTAGHGTINYAGGLGITGSLARLNTLTVTSPLSVGTNAVAADNMNVGIQSMTVGGTFQTTANTQLTYRVNTPTTSGKITATGEATVVAGTKVNMIVDTNVYVAQGQEFVLIDGAESGGHVATLTAGNLTTTNTALLHFKQKTTDTNNLIVYADRVQMNKAAKVPNNAAVGTMLDSLGAGGDKDVTALQVALGKLDTTEQVEAMLATIVPDVSGGTINAAVGVGGSTSTVVNNRVASLRAGESYGSGMAAGNGGEGSHFWGQVFGSSAEQDRRDRIAGYDAESYGTVFGADAEVADSIRAGLAFAYANTEVDGEDANRTQTSLDSYQVSLYGSYDLADKYFLTGQLSYMYSDIDATRYNVGQLAGNNAHADFSSNQYSIRTEVGRDYTVDGTILSLTPSGTFNYTYVDLEDYTERGAGGLSLRNVDTDEVQILEFGGNLKAEAKFEDHAGGEIAPNLHAGYRYDLIGDKVATTGRLTGGGAAFKSEGFEPSQHTVNAGAGIKWTTASDFEFTVNYDFEHKSDYTEHSGFARAGLKF